MSSETFVEADIWTVAQTEQGNVVLVRPRGSDLAVPIFIGQLETQAILIGMGGVEVPRPLTHDLVLSMLRTLGASLLRIEINDLSEGTFYARLVLSAAGGSYMVDARPSDAIGLAVRAGCPVFIAESVVDEAGISVNLVTEAAAGGAELAREKPLGSAEPPAGTVPAAAATAGDEAGSSGEGPGDTERRRLRAELEEAIEREEYERAASLRDRLKELEKDG